MYSNKGNVISTFLFISLSLTTKLGTLVKGDTGCGMGICLKRLYYDQLGKLWCYNFKKKVSSKAKWPRVHTGHHWRRHESSNCRWPCSSAYPSLTQTRLLLGSQSSCSSHQTGWVWGLWKVSVWMLFLTSNSEDTELRHCSLCKKFWIRTLWFTDHLIS